MKCKKYRVICKGFLLFANGENHNKTNTIKPSLASSCKPFIMGLIKWDKTVSHERCWQSNPFILPPSSLFFFPLQCLSMPLQCPSPLRPKRFFSQHSAQ